MKYATKLNISILKAKTLLDEVAIHPQTEMDYRKLARLLQHKNLEYHTYQLPSEKLLHVVVRGIPEALDVEEVKKNLVDKNFHPDTVIRMRTKDHCT